MEATVSYLLIQRNYINSKQKNPEIKDYALYLGNASKDFTISNIKKSWIKRSCKFFYLLVLILLKLTIF